MARYGVEALSDTPFRGRAGRLILFANRVGPARERSPCASSLGPGCHPHLGALLFLGTSYLVRLTGSALPISLLRRSLLERNPADIVLYLMGVRRFWQLLLLAFLLMSVNTPEYSARYALLMG